MFFIVCWEHFAYLWSNNKNRKFSIHVVFVYMCLIVS